MCLEWSSSSWSDLFYFQFPPSLSLNACIYPWSYPLLSAALRFKSLNLHFLPSLSRSSSTRAPYDTGRLVLSIWVLSPIAPPPFFCFVAIFDHRAIEGAAEGNVRVVLTDHVANKTQEIVRHRLCPKLPLPQNTHTHNLVPVLKMFRSLYCKHQTCKHIFLRGPQSTHTHTCMIQTPALMWCVSLEPCRLSGIGQLPDRQEGHACSTEGSAGRPGGNSKKETGGTQEHLHQRGGMSKHFGHRSAFYKGFPF